MNLVPDFILRAGIRYLLRTKCLFHFDNTEDELKAELDSWRTCAREPWRSRPRRQTNSTEVPTEFTSCASAATSSTPVVCTTSPA